MREDGAFIEAGENDNLIVQKLQANPNALGIFGFSFLEENAATIKDVAVDGVKPTFETIADGSYKVARPLFVYVKKQHVDVIPGMKEFVAEYVSEKAHGRGRLPRREGPRDAPRRPAGEGQGHGRWHGGSHRCRREVTARIAGGTADEPALRQDSRQQCRLTRFSGQGCRQC